MALGINTLLDALAELRAAQARGQFPQAPTGTLPPPAVPTIPGALYAAGIDTFGAAPVPSRLNPVFSDSFGMRVHPLSGSRRMHYGQDIKGPVPGALQGTPQVSVIDGTVVKSERQKGAGNMVVVQDAAGNQVSHFHLDSRAVAVGDKVKAGQLIGPTGQTGQSKGPHAHIELRDKDGNRLDPGPAIKAAMPLAAPTPGFDQVAAPPGAFASPEALGIASVGRPAGPASVANLPGESIIGGVPETAPVGEVTVSDLPALPGGMNVGPMPDLGFNRGTLTYIDSLPYQGGLLTPGRPPSPALSAPAYTGLASAPPANRIASAFDQAASAPAPSEALQMAAMDAAAKPLGILDQAANSRVAGAFSAEPVTPMDPALGMASGMPAPLRSIMPAPMGPVAPPALAGPFDPAPSLPAQNYSVAGQAPPQATPAQRIAGGFAAASTVPPSLADMPMTPESVDAMAGVPTVDMKPLEIAAAEARANLPPAASVQAPLTTLPGSLAGGVAVPQPATASPPPASLNAPLQTTTGTASGSLPVSATAPPGEVSLRPADVAGMASGFAPSMAGSAIAGSLSPLSPVLGGPVNYRPVQTTAIAGSPMPLGTFPGAAPSVKSPDQRIAGAFDIAGSLAPAPPVNQSIDMRPAVQTVQAPPPQLEQQTIPDMPVADVPRAAPIDAMPQGALPGSIAPQAPDGMTVLGRVPANLGPNPRIGLGAPLGTQDVIGAGLGALSGGPLGAILGALGPRAIGSLINAANRFGGGGALGGGGFGFGFGGRTGNPALGGYAIGGWGGAYGDRPGRPGQSIGLGR